MVKPIINYLAYALCLLGMIPATLFALFGFFASSELIPYNWIFRILYLLAFLSCSISVAYILYFMIAKNQSRGIANTPLKRIGIVVTIVGLIVTVCCMLLILFHMFGLHSMFPHSETYSWLYIFLASSSAISCLYMVFRFTKILRIQTSTFERS